MNSFFDTHSHLYDEVYDVDRSDVLARSAAEGVVLSLLANVDSSTIAPLREVLRLCPDQTIGAMGLHPTSVRENYREELAVVERELKTGDYAAVGEVGIDLYWDRTFKVEQQEAFARQIEWSLSESLPLVIHSREAFPEVFEVLEEYKQGSLRGVFHSFSGGATEVERILGLGEFYFGINGTLTFKNSTLKEVVGLIPCDRLLLETDAPYLSPVPHRGKRNEPAYLLRTFETLVSLLGEAPETLSEQIFRNSRQLFN